MSPQLVIYKHEGSWHWACRRPGCHQAQWRGRQPDALREGERHLDEHDRFGFTGDRKAKP